VTLSGADMERLGKVRRAEQLLYGLGGVAKDPTAAFALFCEAADAGHLGAAVAVAPA
jgi:TPR repeat protein